LVLLFACLFASSLWVGCAAVTNPVANGVPVRMLDERLLGQSREDYEPIALTHLRRKPPEIYTLAPGDTLGVYIEGILGDAETPPPVNVPDSAELPPSIGYPFPVRQDGTISLPYVGQINVEGLTLDQAEAKVIQAYLDEQILRPDDKRILVTLMRPRYFRVLVIREDSAQQQVSLQNESLLGLGTTRTTIGGGRRATGTVVELPLGENDVLNALARTGGLPGLESTQEVIVQRGYWDGSQSAAETCYCNLPESIASQVDENRTHDGRRRTVRIPLRRKCSDGTPLPFTPEDVILESGDIITVRGRDPEFFYTGGLIPAGEHPLPNDYDLTVLEAILKTRGPVINGGFNASNLNGSILGSGIGNPSPSLLSVLRKTPGNGQVTIQVDLHEAARDPRENILVMAGDVLILQEKPDEAITRYFTQTFRIDFVGRWLNRSDATGTVSVFAP
jgi:protein involved in polysaccharide export with SLBB domain